MVECFHVYIFFFFYIFNTHTQKKGRDIKAKGLPSGSLSLCLYLSTLFRRVQSKKKKSSFFLSTFSQLSIAGGYALTPSARLEYLIFFFLARLIRF